MNKTIFTIATVASLATQGDAWAQTGSRQDTTQFEVDTLATSSEFPKIALPSASISSVRASPLSPFAKTELSKEQLQKNNLGQDLPVLLQYLPSAVMSSDAGNGIGYTGIRIRGTDPTRINVTFNGMPVNDPESQGVFFVNTPDIVSSTSSIQVQRGAGASTNGAGAFGGTISIHNLEQMDTAGFSFSGSVGSFNTSKHTLVAGTGLLKNGFQLDVRLSKIHSDGFVARSGSDLQSMQMVLGYHPSDRTSIHFLFMPGKERTGQAWNGVPQDTLSTNRRYNVLGLKADGTYYDQQTDNYYQNYFQGIIEHKWNEHWNAHVGLFATRGKGYYEEYKLDQAYERYGLNPTISPKGDTQLNTDLIRRLYLDNYYYGGVFSFNYINKGLLATLGGGWNQFQNLHYGNVMWAMKGGFADQYKWYQLDAQKTDMNTFLKVQQQWGKWIAYADIQHRYVNYFMNGFEENKNLKPAVVYHFYNPKGGVTYQLQSEYGKKQTLYASVAVANREPNRTAFETDAQNLPKHERLIDMEVGYEVSRKKWSGSVNGYWMQYKNQLILTGQINNVGAYVQTNVDASYRAGIELQGAYKPFNWLSVNGNMTLSSNKIQNFTYFLDNYDSTGQRATFYKQTDIAFSPNVIASLGFTLVPYTSFKGNRMTIDLMGKYIDRQYLDNTASEQKQIKATQYCNALVSYTIRSTQLRQIVASLSVQNIFNTAYELNGYTYSYIADNKLSTYNYLYPQAGTNVLGSITFKW